MSGEENGDGPFRGLCVEINPETLDEALDMLRKAAMGSSDRQDVA